MSISRLTEDLVLLQSSQQSPMAHGFANSDDVRLAQTQHSLSPGSADPEDSGGFEDPE